MRDIIRSTLGVLLVAILVSVVGCGGGGGGEAATEGDSNAIPVAGSGGSSGEEAPTSAGVARSGDPCDFGGAERMTCSANLVCCYPEGEVEYGSCAATCPGYD